MKKPHLHLSETLAIILCLLVILTAFLIGVVAHIAEASISHCPETGCVFLDKSYYSDYEYGSEMYWWKYCTDMVDLPDSLEHYKCG